MPIAFLVLLASAGSSLPGTYGYGEFAGDALQWEDQQDFS